MSDTTTPPDAPKPAKPTHAPPAKPADAIQTEAQAVAAFEQAGYTYCLNVTHHGRIWSADATDASGAPCLVKVHSKNGRVHLGDE